MVAAEVPAKRLRVLEDARLIRAHHGASTAITLTCQ